MWGLGNDLSNAAPHRADRDSETGVSHGTCRSRCSSELRGPAPAARWEAPVLACGPRARRRGPVTPPAKGALGFVTDAAPGNRSSEDLRTAGGRQAL